MGKGCFTLGHQGHQQELTDTTEDISALDLVYVEGFVEGCLERVGEDDPEGEETLRGEWEDGDRHMVLEVLKADVEVREGRPPGD